MHASQAPLGSTLTCNAHALRQAARHVSALYDQALAPFGLRGTQYSILARVAATGPWTVQALASKLVMDRTTLGRAIQPLKREGLVSVGLDPADRRVRVITITPAGTARLDRANAGWGAAQARYEAAIGAERAEMLRSELKQVANTRF